MRDKLKDAHVKRLTNGTCTIELGFVFSDLITNIERVSDHCSNIAIGVIEINRNGYDAHEYLHELKNSDDIQYNADYKAYKQKYTLPKEALSVREVSVGVSAVSHFFACERFTCGFLCGQLSLSLNTKKSEKNCKVVKHTSRNRE